MCTGSIWIPNQTHRVIIKLFRVRVKNDLAAAAAAIVSIPVVLYPQGRVVNARRRKNKKAEDASFPWHDWRILDETNGINRW